MTEEKLIQIQFDHPEATITFTTGCRAAIKTITFVNDDLEPDIRLISLQLCDVWHDKWHISEDTLPDHLFDVIITYPDGKVEVQFHLDSINRIDDKSWIYQKG